MITGDHPLTAAYIAKQSGLVHSETTLILVDMFKEDPVFTNLVSNVVVPISKVEASLAYGDVELVITGGAFKALSQTFWIQSHLKGLDLCTVNYLGCAVFARMNPEEKALCVRMQMAQNITVNMFLLLILGDVRRWWQ